MGADKDAKDAPARYVDIFAVREFRYFWLATVQSALGDQLAKVALSVLVFDRTGSPLLAAATYAVSYLPYVLAGLLFSAVADVFRRREVMVSSDTIRAAVMAVMFVPGLPIWLYLLLVGLAGMLRQPFDAARLALLPDMMKGDLYIGGSAVTQVTNQVTQVVGFAVGGAAVATIGARESLLINAGTFALSAVLLRLGLADRPRTAGGAERSRGLETLTLGFRAVAADSRLVVVLCYLSLTAFFIVPEALVVPFVHGNLDLSSFHAGLLLTAQPLGVSLGTALASRLVPPSRRRELIGPLPVLGLLLLAPFWFVPGLTVAYLLLLASGMTMAYTVATYQTFVEIVADDVRGRALGLGQTVLMLSQGVGVVLGGLLADHISNARAIGLIGAVGALVAGVTWVAWRRAARYRS